MQRNRPFMAILKHLKPVVRCPIFGGVDPPTNDLELPLWFAGYFGYAMGKWPL